MKKYKILVYYFKHVIELINRQFPRSMFSSKNCLISHDQFQDNESVLSKILCYNL